MKEPVGMNTSTMASGKIQLSIPSHPQYLQLVRGVVKKATGIIGVSRKDSDHIILAVDEACSNIIKHSYMNNPRKTIDISIETSFPGRTKDEQRRYWPAGFERYYVVRRTPVRCHR